MQPAAICPQARWNGAWAKAKMIRAAPTTGAASDRPSNSPLMPSRDSSAGSDVTLARDLRRLQHRDTAGRDQALQRHLRDNAEHDHHDQRAQIAAAEQHQRPRATSVRQHHTVTEQHPAKKHQRR